jgi:hypothetical protein
LVLSRISSLMKTSGGGIWVLLLIAAKFWAIVSAGGFWCVGVTGRLKRVPRPQLHRSC